MASNGEGSVTVSFEVLSELIEKEGGFKIPADAEVVFGNARFREGKLEFSFAWDNDDFHPKEWAKGPVWLKGKTIVNDGHLRADED